MIWHCSCRGESITIESSGFVNRKKNYISGHSFQLVCQTSSVGKRRIQLTKVQSFPQLKDLIIMLSSAIDRGLYTSSESVAELCIHKNYFPGNFQKRVRKYAQIIFSKCLCFDFWFLDQPFCQGMKNVVWETTDIHMNFIKTDFEQMVFHHVRHFARYSTLQIRIKFRNYDARWNYLLFDVTKALHTCSLIGGGKVKCVMSFL